MAEPNENIALEKQIGENIDEFVIYFSSGKQQHSERLDIHGPPTPREVLKVETKEGYALTLQCPMGGFPLNDSATWKDGNGNPVESVLGELKFENIKEDDKGIYTCTMKNTETHENATAKINLEVVKGK